MRTKIVFGVLLSLFVASIALWVARGQIAHEAPKPPPEIAAASASASASAAPLTSASVALSASAASSASAEPPKKPMDRPMRVIALGWELGAPLVLANGGLEPGKESAFSAADLEVHAAVVDTMEPLEAAMARGGGDKNGADVAILPFCSFVAAYERLKALSPEAFFVTGWSQGREALFAKKGSLPLPGDRDVSLMGAAEEPSTFLGLFALEVAGHKLDGLELVPFDKSKIASVRLWASDRDSVPDGAPRDSVVMTTADASRLMPFVAVAPHGLLDKNEKALLLFARAFLEGAQKLASDPPEAARQIATAKGAPEPIALLKRLGQLSSASLLDNAEMMALSGRGALSLSSLFDEAFRIYRASGVLAMPAPESAPIATGVVTQLVRSSPSLLGKAAKAKNGDKKTEGGAEKVLLSYAQPVGKFDEAALLSRAAFLAEIFERSSLRITLTRGPAVDATKTQKLIANIEERFGVAPGRLVVAKKAPPRTSAAVEVMAAP